MPKKLEYSPQAPWHRRRRYRRVFVLVGVAVFLVAGWREGPGVWFRAKLYYYERQCLNYAGGKDEVVGEPSTILGVGGSSLTAFLKGSMPATRPPLGPPCLLKLQGLLPTPGVAGIDARGFLHERRDRQGVRKLVLVAPPTEPVEIEYAIIDITALNKAPVTTPIIHTASCYPRVGIVEFGPVVRVYAGQADPLDQTHFTFRYEMGRDSGTIDAYLRDNDDIVFRVRDGPASKPTGQLEIHDSSDPMGPFRSPAGMDLIDDRPSAGK